MIWGKGCGGKVSGTEANELGDSSILFRSMWWLFPSSRLRSGRGGLGIDLHGKRLGGGSVIGQREVVL